MSNTATVHFCINPRCSRHLAPTPGGNRCRTCGERALNLDDALTLTLALAQTLKISGATKFTGEIRRMCEKE